ncbi:lipopolysaccharide biosynthesis protein [Kineobactrum salinum]|uniref:Lipopolysaccharide biosynthesis protein n=1 Tax=Kineobactrum salinum TaxID=2708301 RepID=A0A6C0U160_9GAMM|nr:lipopolysaccharide biosynthesis protein [Kineobactrum salinum]QIB64717.1 lipopolysaccharide biosynthesis protein [Kineobactrum salinum]
MTDSHPTTPRTPEQNTRVHNKVYSGSGFMVITRMSIKSIGLISSVVLARLLVPEDFGLVAIAMAIYAFIELFGALGLGTVLIQRQSSNTDDYNTAWTFTFVFGFFAAACMAGLAPLVADFYQEPRLQNVIYVISLASIFSGAANIGVVNFQKDMDFRKELRYQLIPKLISFFITLTLALVYRNYWALVLGTVSSQLIRLVFSYIMHPFRPRFGFKSFNKLFSFSRWLLLNNVLLFLNERLSGLLVGSMLSTSAVGFFSLGREIAVLPTAELAKPINRATFPVYARFKDDFVELRRAYLNTSAMTVALTMPAALGIALLAPLLVEVVMGAKWLPMAPLIQLFAIAGVLGSLTVNNSYVYMACGKPNVMFTINLLRTMLFFALFFPLIDSNGLIGIGQARLATTLIALSVVQGIMLRFLQLSFTALLSALLRPVVSCAVMALVVVLLQRTQIVEAQWLRLLVLVVAGGASYFFVSMATWYAQRRPDGLERAVLDWLASWRQARR